MEKKKEDLSEIIFKLIVGFVLILGVVAMIYFFISVGKDVDELKSAETIQTFTVKGVAVDNQASGSFALGFGSVGNKDYFVCYIENEDGGLQLKRFSANDTTIYQTLESDEEAYMEITTKLSGTKNKIYVPKDTIQVEYNLSLTE